MPKKMNMHRPVFLFVVLMLTALIGLTYYEYSKQPEVLIQNPSLEHAAGQKPSLPAKGPVAVETETRIPIIMYHYVREVDKTADPLGWNLSIRPDIFEEQLKWLKEQGYVSVHLEDLLDGKVPDKAVVLSFDDGLLDFYTTALPLLKEYGFTASNAVISGMVGAHEHMTEDQIRECLKAGIEIISHTVGHVDLSLSGAEEVQRQVTGSRDYLEDKFDISVFGFVYPSGKYNDTVVRILGEEGYTMALTTEPGVADLSSDDFLRLPRVRIDNRDGFEGFVAKMKAPE